MNREKLHLKINQDDPLKLKYMRTGGQTIRIFFGSSEIHIHQEVLGVCHGLKEKIEEDSKVVKIQGKFSMAVIQKIVHILYGMEILICRHSEIQQFFEIVNALKVNTLLQKIREDFEVNFEEYPVFTLLKISNKIDDKDLKKRCFQSLQNENFQQINYQKYGILQLQKSLFEAIIEFYELRKRLNKAIFLPKDEFTEIIRLYEQNNNETVDYEGIINRVQREHQTIFMQNSSQDLQVSPKGIRKRNATWDQCTEKQREFFGIQKEEKSLKCSERITKQQNKNCLLKTIKEQNIKLSQRSLEFFQEIKLFSQSVRDSTEKGDSTIDMEISICEKLQVIQQEFQRNDKKLNDLQKKMSKILKKSQHKINLSQKKQANSSELDLILQNIGTSNQNSYEKIRKRRGSHQISIKNSLFHPSISKWDLNQE